MLAIFQVPNKFFEADGRVVDASGEDWDAAWGIRCSALAHLLHQGQTDPCQNARYAAIDSGHASLLQSGAQRPEALTERSACYYAFVPSTQARPPCPSRVCMTIATGRPTHRRSGATGGQPRRKLMRRVPHRQAPPGEKSSSDR